MQNIKGYILLEFNYRPIRKGNEMINNEKLGEKVKQGWYFFLFKLFLLQHSSICI